MIPLRYSIFKKENGTVTVRLDFKSDTGSISSSWVNYASADLARKGMHKMQREASVLSAEVLEEEIEPGTVKKASRS